MFTHCFDVTVIQSGNEPDVDIKIQNNNTPQSQNYE